MFRVVNRGRVVQSCGLKVKRLKIKTLDIPPDDSTQLKVDLKPGIYELYHPVATTEDAAWTARLRSEKVRNHHSSRGRPLLASPRGVR